MRANLISNLTNGAGLQRDYELLRGMLEAEGHRVAGIMYNQPPPYPAADLNIWLEILPCPSWGITETAISAAPRNWAIPNPEWWYANLWDRYLPMFEKVLCKTEHCREIFERKAPGRCRYIGFESLDLCDISVPREPRFLHLAGASETKNTAAVMEAWRKHALPYPLTVVARKPNIAALCQGIPNVTHRARAEEAELRQLVNSHLFFLMPSKSEGFGHGLHEALSCGAVVLTTDHPPMNQMRGVPGELLIPIESTFEMRSAVAANASVAGIAEKVRQAASLPQERIAEISRDARQAFWQDRDYFREQWRQLFA